jgi:hypothetical protein
LQEAPIKSLVSEHTDRQFYRQFWDKRVLNRGARNQGVSPNSWDNFLLDGNKVPGLSNKHLSP